MESPDRFVRPADRASSMDDRRGVKVVITKDAYGLVAGEASSVGMSEARIERACSYVEQVVQEGSLPLAEVLIARRGTVVCHRHFVNPNVKDMEFGIEGSAYYLASVTKLLVATLVMQQVEMGNLMLEGRVADYIPEFGQRDKQGVTLRHLLSHSSGLPDQLSLPITATGPMSMFLEEIYRQPLVFEPGTRSSYCTWGYTLLAELLQRVSGNNLEQLGREMLFDSLNMRDTHFGLDGEWRNKALPIYNEEMEHHHAYNTSGLLSMMRGDIGAYSTCSDLAAFCQMYLNKGAYGGEQILSPITVQRMTERQFAWQDSPERLSGTPREQFVSLSKGLGWQVRGEGFFRGCDIMSPRAFFHGGGAGIRIIVDPEYDLTSIFMTSVMPSDIKASPLYSPSMKAQNTFGNMAFAAVVEL